MRYETAPGFVLDLANASIAEAKALNVIQTLAEQKGTKHASLIAAIYSPRNPALAPMSMVPGTGIVTPAVLKNPVYQAMCDVLFRFELRMLGRSLGDEAQTYTVSVTEAGRALGMTPDAVRKAINERRLAAWRRFLPDPSQGNQWFLLPASIATFARSNKGPKPA